MTDDDWRESLLRQLCDYRVQFLWIFSICAAFAIIQAPYLIVVEPGTKLYVISLVNFVGLVFFGGLSAVVLWRCRKLQERQPI